MCFIQQLLDKADSGSGLQATSPMQTKANRFTSALPAPLDQYPAVCDAIPTSLGEHSQMTVPPLCSPADPGEHNRHVTRSTTCKHEGI
jgi:hypothetical protein